jgi:predicted Zn-dependent protease
MLPAGAVSQDVLDQMPPALSARFGHELGRQRIRRTRLHVVFALLASIVMLPLILLGAFWAQADRIAGWAASHISLEQEVQLGELAFAQMRPSLKMLDTGQGPAIVQAIGTRLTAGSAYRYQWHVAADPQVNAFALPGGHVVVFTGLLQRADSAEEVAGVLAHEVQHVELRHSLKNLLHGLGWRALLAVALGDLSGGVWAGMAEQLGSLSYSRDLERQADLGGLAALRRAGIAPQGMASFFAKLAQQDGAQIELLSTHPASEDRLQALQAVIRAQGSYAASPLPYDWAALRRSLPPAARPVGP